MALLDKPKAWLKSLFGSKAAAPAETPAVEAPAATATAEAPAAPAAEVKPAAPAAPAA